MICVADPDYARIFTQVRVIAWQYGWACLAHGSATRDLDLVLVPWTENARSKSPESLIARIADVAGLTVIGDTTDKPFGRRAWTLRLPGFSEVRWVDISVIGILETQTETDDE